MTDETRSTGSALTSVALSTGEEIVEASPTPTSLALMPEVYAGISGTPVNDAQSEILTAPVSYEQVEIKPDRAGSVYLSHAHYRRRLNMAFKPAGWALRRISEVRWVGGVMYAEFALYAEGRFLSQSTGEQKYQDNGEMTFGDALEGAKSNALMRCCKDLGVGLECWNREWTDAYRRAACVKVFVKKGDKTAVQWRKLEAEPFYGETGICDDSPNQDKYILPKKAQRSSRPPNPPEQASRPARAPAAAAQPRITREQAAGMWKAIREKGLDEEEVTTYIKKTYNVERTMDLTVGQYDGVMAMVSVYEAGVIGPRDEAN